MKPKLTKIMACLLVAVLMFSAVPVTEVNLGGLFIVAGAAETEGIFTYESNYDSVTITKCDNTVTGEVVIPATLGGKQVKYIGEKAFEWCDKMTSVVVPKGVMSISSNAFLNCIDLESITIPGSLSYIDGSAFTNCNKLKKVYISDLAAWCNGFGSYRCPFSGFDLYLNGELLTEVIIPDSVTKIGNYAFANCKSIVNVTIPESVTTIGDSAFSHCENLTDIEIPDGVTSIGSSVFESCSSLKSITIPGSISQIDNYSFDGCSSL